MSEQFDMVSISVTVDDLITVVLRRLELSAVVSPHRRCKMQPLYEHLLLGSS